MQDVDELNAHRRLKDDEDEGNEDQVDLWEPSGSWWRDFLFFSGPGRFYFY
jgi:hypothetical protein